MMKFVRSSNFMVEKFSNLPMLRVVCKFEKTKHHLRNLDSKFCANFYDGEDRNVTVLNTVVERLISDPLNLCLINWHI